MTARTRLPESLLHLATTDSALGCAQRQARQVVAAWGLQHVADVVELLTVEMVSVALGRTSTGRRLRYRDLLCTRLVGLRFQHPPEGLVIATWDNDPRPPRLRQPGSGPHDESELYYVPMLAEAWDFFRSGSGKVVWCELRIPPPGDRRLPRRTPLRDRAEPASIPDIALLGRVREGLLHLDSHVGRVQ